MDSENILKGKLAESIVQELLREAGNRVYRFGNLDFFDHLIREDSFINRESETGKKIASMPDFLVISPKKKSIFIEVKFRTDPEALEEELLLEKEPLEKFWQAKIILVTIKKPYLRVLNPPYFKKEKSEGWPIPVFNWQSIETDLDLGVNSSILKKFERLIKRYYKKSI